MTNRNAIQVVPAPGQHSIMRTRKCPELAAGEQSLTIRVMDTETTGLEDPIKLVEVGYVDIRCRWGRNDDMTLLWDMLGYGTQMLNPGCPIPPQAMAVHHITDDDVAAAPDAATFGRPPGSDAYILAAHNAAYDAPLLPEYASDTWVCTKRLATHQWPEAPAHSNQVLRYWLKLPVNLPDHAPMHRALPDAFVTASLMRRIVDERWAVAMKNGRCPATGADLAVALHRRSETPALLSRVPFGKHRGSLFVEVPDSYLSWVLDKMDDPGPDVVHTCREELKRRAKSGISIRDERGR